MSAQAVLQREAYRREAATAGVLAPELGAVEGARAEGARTTLRLTRRGRIVFGGLATVLVAALIGFLAAVAAPQALASSRGAGEQQFHYVVVQPGATLWGLATELDPRADPRDLVAEIVQLNQLGGSDIEAGEAIAVPLRYSERPAVFSGDEFADIAG